jgi:hypothetical protein
VWRSRPEGAIGYTLPAICVQDSDEAIVLFQPAGTRCKKRSGRRGGPRGRNLVDWSGGYGDVVFRPPGVIRLHVPGTAHSVMRGWNDGAIAGWYVNLERPWTRTPIGVDSHDDVLDVEAADDLSSWTWKDEDELAWAVEQSKVSRELADAIRMEGERVGAAIESRAWPFCEDWMRWAPDPSWLIPALPDGWDVP